MRGKRLRELLTRGSAPDTGASINASLELFEGLSRPEITELGSYFTIITVKAGTDLGRAGTSCQQFSVVLSGQVGMSFEHAPVGFLDAGCFFGAVALLEPNMDHRRRGTAVAMVDTKLAIANPREFAGLLYTFPLVAERIHEVVERRRSFIAAAERETATVSEDITYPVHVPSD